MTKPPGAGRMPRGLAYVRPLRRPRWCRMPTMGIHRLPAISSTSGLAKPATKRMARRASGQGGWFSSVSCPKDGTDPRGVTFFGNVTFPRRISSLFDGHRMIDSSGFNEAWSEHHGFLLDVAYRLLGSYGDAEDIVQEAFSRLLRTDIDPIEDVRAWLVVVVSRLCLDQLRSARVRHESYIGPWFPEPLLQLEADSADPADVVTLDESVRMAMLIVLERMSPAERVVFVLHDIFEFPFEKVAEMVGRTPAACRQLATRARRRVK